MSIYSTINIDNYLSNNDKCTSPTDLKLINNANVLLDKIDKIAKIIYEDTGTIFTLSSGYRPSTYNIAVGGAIKSTHSTCEGIDILDNYGLIDTYLIKNQNLLKEYTLFVEHPYATLGWCHIQTRLIKSGRLFFWPCAKELIKQKDIDIKFIDLP